MPKGYDRDVKPASEQPPPPRVQHFAVGPPEGQAWFQRLPPAAQDEFRARWKAEDVLDAKREGFAHTSLKRSIAQATLLFFFNETFCSVPSLWHSLAAVVVGAILGCYWHRVGAGRFKCMTSSIGPFVALRIAFFGDVNNSWALAITLMADVLGFLMLLGVTALVGVIREQRRADDEDY